MADSRNLLVRMRQFAGDYYSDYGYEIPIHILADKLAEFAQLYTQEAYMRPLCSISILFSIDDERGPQIFKVDSIGHYVWYKAIVAGEKEQGATNQLKREIKKKSYLSRDKTLRVAIKALQNPLSMEFRNTDIEIGMVTTQVPYVDFLTPEEIQIKLNKVGETD